jgi:hypothetical protein
MRRSQPFRRTVAVAQADATAEMIRQLTIDVAREELGVVVRAKQAESGKEPAYRRWVDWQEGAPETAVKAYGRIEYRFGSTAEVAEWVLKRLYEISPLGPPVNGHYRDDHQILVNGVPVAGIEDVGVADEIKIVNLRPYARKIEVVMPSLGRRLSLKAPDGVYQVTARAARAQFRGQADISFAWQAYEGPGVPVIRPRSDTASGREAARRFPTIIIAPGS